MPVFYTDRNIHDTSGKQFDGIFSFFLILAAATNTDKHLSATRFCIVDVPVVAATGFKSYIENRNLLF